MAILFFIAEDGKTKVRLDTEVSIEVSLPSTVAKSSVMSGKSVSDDVIEGNATISVAGKVTYSKLPSRIGENLNPIEFQDAIQVARSKGRRFTVYMQDEGYPLLQDYKDCVIKDCNFTVDKYTDTITVRLVFNQVFVSASAKKTFLKPKKAKESEPTTAEKEDSGQATGTETTDTEDKTIWTRLTEYVDNFNKGIPPTK